MKKKKIKSSGKDERNKKKYNEIGFIVFALYAFGDGFVNQTILMIDFRERW